MQEYKKAFINFFNFKGRARRREYWVACFMNSAAGSFLIALICLSCSIVGDPLFYSTGYEVGFSTSGSLIGTVLAVPTAFFSVYIVLFNIALTVRRLHDISMPGWVYPVCLFGCCLCGIGALALFIFTLIPSKGDNKYGPDPKAPGNNEYHSNKGIVISVVIYVISLVLSIAMMVLNIQKCGYY